MLRTLLVAGLAAAALAVTTSVAQAHSPSWAYEFGTYPVARDSLSFRFHTSVPKGRWRSRISLGAQEWNRYGRRLTFDPPAATEPSVTTEPTFGCPQPSNTPRPSIIFRSSASAFGSTFRCFKVSDNRPFYFRMFFSAKNIWWTDANNNRKIPFDRGDLQSVATHEFGHAGGWGPHYDDNPKDPNAPKVFKDYCRIFNDQTTPNDRPNGHRLQNNLYKAQNTMCSTTPKGSVHQRSLAAHDRGTFGNGYGAR